MEKQDKSSFSEKKLDSAFDRLLLEENEMFNEEIMQAMASHVFASTLPGSSYRRKEKELLRRLTGETPRTNYRFYLNGILLLLALGLAGTILFYQMRPGEKASLPAVVAREQKTQESSSAVPEKAYEDFSEFSPKQSASSDPGVQIVPPVFADSGKYNHIELLPPTQAEAYTGFHIPEEISFAYEDIPQLNDDDVKKTAKDKLKIMRELTKKHAWSSLPAGATLLNGTLTPVNAFTAKSAEITNFEYRTFLNDLLVQGRHEDYLAAAPVKGGWIAAGIPELENVYFSSEKYNDFPAVNMSRRGAELYCEWMTVSFADAVKNKDVKWSGPLPDFRLPSNLEWVYAARACDTSITLPWGKYRPDSVQNSIGCYLCNINYDRSKSRVRPSCSYYAKSKKTGRTHPVMTTAGLAIDTLLTAPVFSYNPNDKWLYCTIGNVSEMAWTWQPETPSVRGAARSMGGNWNSSVEEARIESTEQYVGVTAGSAMIGFRPVYTLK